MSLWKDWSPLFRDWIRFQISTGKDGEITLKKVTVTIDQWGVMVDDPTPENIANKFHFCAKVRSKTCGGSGYISANTLQGAEEKVMGILGVVLRSIDNPIDNPPEPKDKQLSLEF